VNDTQLSQAAESKLVNVNCKHALRLQSVRC